MTNINDILGYKCINQERLAYDKCRNCAGRDYHCDDYLSVYTKHKSQQKSSRVAHSRLEPDRMSADVYVPMIIRNNELIIRKHSKLLDKIRKFNDWGVI